MDRKSVEKRLIFALAEERKALAYLSKISLKNIADAVELLAGRPGRIITTGVGKSSFAAMKMAATLTSLGRPASFLHPLEAMHGDAGIVRPGDAVIAISFSGESAEVVKIVKHLKANVDILVVAITGNQASRLAKLADAVIRIKIDKEGCPIGLAPMASVTSSLVAGDMLAAGLTSPAEFSHRHFAAFHPAGTIGLKLKKVSEVMWTGNRISLIDDKTPIKEAFAEITKKKRGVAGVVNKKHEIIGIITDGDIRRFFLKHDSLNGFTARDLMTKHPKTIGKDESLQEALAMMEENKITSLFVTGTGRKIVGIVHIHEILENTLA